MQTGQKTDGVSAESVLGALEHTVGGRRHVREHEGHMHPPPSRAHGRVAPTSLAPSTGRWFDRELAHPRYRDADPILETDLELKPKVVRRGERVAALAA